MKVYLIWVEDARRVILSMESGDAVRFLLCNLEGVACDNVKFQLLPVCNNPEEIRKAFEEAFGGRLFVVQLWRRLDA